MCKIGTKAGLSPRSSQSEEGSGSDGMGDRVGSLLHRVIAYRITSVHAFVITRDALIKTIKID